ncbi:MAG: hypothetical protein GY938_31810 [Ketobacter sp.]|nr:hypothetical protein [Ketobacter sp.]
MGCLSCDADRKCYVCDFIKGYDITADKNCTRKEVTNCLMNQPFDTAGGCFVCMPGFFIDNKNCTGSNAVTNCEYYLSATECARCKKGFFLASATQCSVVTNSITNCAVYSNASGATCAVCDNGFTLALNKASCVAEPTTHNCTQFNFISCAACDSDQYLNKNSFINTYFNPKKASTTNLIKAIHSSIWMGVLPVSSPCSASPANCATFDQFGVCSACISDYYLNQSNICQVNPSPAIAFCMVYFSKTNCQECQTGYYRKSATECVINTTVSNCLTYDGTASTTTCLECISGYYLNSAGACLARTTIANCLTYNVTTDQCLVCEQSYHHTTNFKKCLLAVG